MATVPIADGRRQRRRQETIDEILAAAMAAMTLDGVAGLSLSDVARRVGIRPPSMYEYFPSKMALYDSLFESGYRQLNEAILARVDVPGLTPLGRLRVGFGVFVEWSLTHPVLAELMLWRPVPGFRPSERAFAASVVNLQIVGDAVARAVDGGELDPSALSDAGLALLNIVGSGLITQQLANDPASAPADGRFSRHVGAAFDLWSARFARQPKEHR